MNIFAELLAGFTGAKRYQIVPGIDFEWNSKAWVYNLFRLYEMVFWRKEGVRQEAMSAVVDGRTEYTFFTLEARLAHYEGVVRAFFRQLAYFKIRVAKMQVVGGPTISFPYVDFSIAFDTIDGRGEFTGNNSGAYTVTGSNPLILTWAFCTSSTTQSLNPTASTYNSVSLTAITGSPFLSGSLNAMGLWILPGCATGSNTLAVTGSGTLPYYYGGWSYSGCKQTSQPDNSRTATFNGTALSGAITTVADNCRVLLFIQSHTGDNVDPSSLSNLTQRQAWDTSYKFDNNADVTPAGSLTQSATMHNSADWGYFQLSLAPAAGAAAPRLTILGAGT